MLQTQQNPVGESNFETEFQRISAEISTLKKQIKTEKSKQKSSKNNSNNLDEIMATLKSEDGILGEFDDVVVRKIVEYIKVVSTDKIMVVFKGGAEMVGEMK